MARTVLPIVGAVVGFYFGGPTGAQIGFALGGAIGGAVDPVVNRGPKIGETGAQTSAEGAPRAIVYGTSSVTGNVIATGPMIETTNTETQSKGGPVSETSVAYRSFAIRICEGPIGGVLRVWQDDKLVYDARPGSPLAALTAGWLANKIIYLGTETQLPDIFLELNVSGPGETPAYRGTSYIVFGLEDLTDRRGSIPQYRFEVASTTTATQILAPLQVFNWDGSRPAHGSGGETNYVPFNGGGSYSDFGAAAAAGAANAAINTHPSAAESTTYLAYTTSLNEAIASVFSGGANLSGNPQTVTYRLAAREPDRWIDDPVASPYLCGAMAAINAEVDDGMLYGINVQALDNRLELTKLFHYPAAGTGTFSYFHNNCTNYPAEGANFPQATGTPTLRMTATRVPSPPEGYTKVIGTATILADVEYRDGALYQNALGPVLLPGDPDYGNATFWSDARTAAIAAGTLNAGVASTPVTVGAYAVGGNTLSGAPVSLGDIVADIHDRCGIPATKFDRTELVDMVAGLVLAGDYTGADAINTLRGPYFFDKAEYDKKLWYPKRGAAVVHTLTIDDLVEEPDTSRREQALEFPKKLHLFYQHAASGYAAVKATSSRSSPDSRVIGEASVQVPVVLNEDQAAQTAHKMHKVAWAEAEGEVQLSVPESFIRLVPSDNVGLVLRGQVKRLRIEKTEHADGVITLTLRHDRQSAYTSGVTGVPIPLPTPPPMPVTNTTITTFSFIDISARVDNQDDLHYLVAGTSADAGWNGWTLQRSLDGGATYTNVASYSTPAVMGTLLDAVPAASEHYTDTTNTVRVELIRETQTIDTITEAQFLSEGGAFALEKTDGTWEVMQYLDAAQDSGGVYELSTLHRGRLNSGAGAHSVGARFVMLNTAFHVPAQSAWIGQNLTHRAVSLGQSPEMGTVLTKTFLGRSQIEWPVASLALARSGADIITATWAPRHRFGTDDAPIASVNFTGYRVTLDGGVTFDTTTAGFTYDASALGDPLTVTVSALNRITGAGPSTTGSV